MPDEIPLNPEPRDERAVIESALGGTDGEVQRPSGVAYALEFLKIFLIAAAIILPLRFFVVQPFYVKGASMEPNFHESEYLISDKLSPMLRGYRRGEVVVFRYPPTERRYLIKRVIGLPGERVLIKNRKVTIFNAENPKGWVLDETSYGPRPLRDDSIDVLLKKDEYFVLGDNRPNSLDSGRFGPIREDQLIGRVVLRGLPVSEFGLIKTPTYK